MPLTVKKIRLALAAWMLVGLTGLAGASSASASLIGANGFNSGNFTAYANGAGQFNVNYNVNNVMTSADSRFYYDAAAGPQSDGDADGGLNIGLYDADGAGTAMVFGFRGTPFVPTNAATPVVNAVNGSSWTLTSRYTTGDCTNTVRCLLVTETVQYVTGDTSALVTYDVANISPDGQPARFRMTAGGDVLVGGDEGGTGRYTGTAPRLIGTINQGTGAGVEFQESTGGGSPPWTAYQEDVPFQIWRQVQNPVTGGLTSQPQQGYSDKAVAVQWDTYKTSGLPWCPELERPACAGKTAHFEYRLYYRNYDALAYTQPSAKATHGTVSVPVTARNDDNGLTNLSNAPLRYRTASYSANVLTSNDAWLTATPTGSGTASIAYTGDNAGNDYLQLWVDSDNDNQVDANEAQRQLTIAWYDRTAISSIYDSFAYVGYDNRANLNFRTALNAPEARSFQYRIWDKTNGAWRTPLSSVLTTSASDGNYHDPLKPVGEPGIHFTRTSPGVDTVYVYSDLNGDADYADPGEVATRDVSWENRVALSPGDSEQVIGTTPNMTVYRYTTTGSGDTTTALRYWVTDGGVDGADQLLSTGTATYGTIPMSRATPGRQVFHVYLDADGSSSYTPNVDPIATATVDWVLDTYQQIKFNGTSDAVIGEDRAVSITVGTGNGGPVADGTRVRYSVNSDENARDLAETDAPDTVGGETTVTLPAASNSIYDGVSVYADLNQNNRRDGNEPSATRYIYWYPAVYVRGYDTHVPAAGSANVEFRDADGELIDPGAYTYSVAGAHSIASTPGPSASSGDVYITWPAGADYTTGTDTITVNAPNMPTSSKSGQGTVKFFDEIDLYPWTQTKTVGQTVTVSPQLYSGTNTGRVFQYTVTGANPRSGSVTYPNDIVYAGANPGTDTITVTTNSGAAVGHATVQWNPEALTLSAPTDVTQGSTVTVAATARDATSGAAVQNATLRWTRSGANYTGGKNAALTDSNGALSITWQASAKGDDYLTVYSDLNNDGARQSGEPQKSVAVTVHPRLEPDDTYDSPYQGSVKTVKVTYRKLDYTPEAGKQLLYRIVDQSNTYTAGNPKATAVAGVTNSSGQLSVSWTGTRTGNDRLQVWDDVDGQGDLDPAEPLAQTDVDWLSRLSMSPNGSTTRNVTAGPLAVTGTLRNSAGAPLANTPLRYRVEGVNATSGVQTTTTNGSGQYTLSMSSTQGGLDQLTVWQDVVADNAPDASAGEPVRTLDLTWQATVSITPVAQDLYQGATMQQLQVSGTPALSNATVRVSYSGPNQRPAERYGNVSGTLNLSVLTGDLAGTDYVTAWIDTDDDGNRDLGEASATATVKWRPRITLGTPTGSLEAGQPTTVQAKLLDVAGAAVPGILYYAVTGANSVPATWYAVDATGAPAVSYTGLNSGTDTLTVWADTKTANGTWDPGEPKATETIQWTAPPVTLTPAALSDRKRQGNTASFVVTLANNPAANGGNSGRTIRWSVTGANSASGTAITNGVGQATISYQGDNDGQDTVTAYADVSGSVGSPDGFDPSATMTMTWDPLVQISGGPSEDAIGGSHSETVTFVDSSGAPLANTQVIYQITGANPTAGQVVARAYNDATGGRVLQRTDGSGNATITWTGSNPAGGSDTLDVWADRNSNGTVDGSEPHASKVVSWRTATAASGTPGGRGTTPTGSASAVTPGSVEDIDGLPSPPPPVVAKSVNVTPVSGKVYVKLPGKKNFISLLDAEQIPVGSIVDVRKGRVALTSAQNLTGGVATAEFYAGQFQIGQKRAAKPITDLTLVGGSLAACGNAARKSGATQSAKKKIRELWGKGTGLFRTKGKYAAASVRGTTWDVADYCDGTLVKVAQGLVSVHDNVLGKDRLVKAGKSYFAAAKKATSGRKRG